MGKSQPAKSSMRSHERESAEYMLDTHIAAMQELLDTEPTSFEALQQQMRTPEQYCRHALEAVAPLLPKYAQDRVRKLLVMREQISTRVHETLMSKEKMGKME